MAEDDLKKDWDQEDQSKDSIVEDQITNVINNNEEDYEFNHIQGYKWERGLLIFDVVLTSGKNFEVPFHMLKKDRPIETAKYILKEVVEQKRGRKHSVWARNVIKKASRTVGRLSRYHNIDRVI